MGMEHKVSADPKLANLWTELSTFCKTRAFPLQLRMIDGELAFPDETPPETWRELRVGTPGGMITLRREADGINVVTWGNADAGMRRSWNALTLALTVVMQGAIQSDGVVRSAEAFRASAELPDGFQ